jgi:hypothetical protein
VVGRREEERIECIILCQRDVMELNVAHCMYIDAQETWIDGFIYSTCAYEYPLVQL